MKTKAFFTLISLLLLAAFTLTACGTQNASTAPGSATPSAASASSTPKASEKASAEPTPTPAPAPDVQLDTETLKNDSGKVMIKSITTVKNGDYHTSFGLVSKEGTVVVMDPYQMPADKGFIKPDIITITHSHSDHVDTKYIKIARQFSDIKMSFYKPEEFTVKDIKDTGIAASHNGAIVTPPSNVIYVFEVDGLRIAHMGDMGQDELTEDQLKALGKIDIAFTIITNAPQYGAMTERNLKILQQLNPKIICPTHFQKDVVDEICGKLGIKEQETLDVLTVSPEDLKDMPQRYINLQ
ncbi:MAG: MBL fold metallo-hydrolase [Clostridia bacterium]|nr:MBL fold metallo-hydrolase [Clostridia bacterium]